MYLHKHAQLGSMLNWRRQKYNVNDRFLKEVKTVSDQTYVYTRWSGKADKFEGNADTQGKCTALFNLSFKIKEPLNSRSHQCLFKEEQF